MDELAFEVGEIINVVEYDDPEEQVRNIFIVVVVIAVADCEVSDPEGVIAVGWLKRVFNVALLLSIAQ